MENIPGAEKIRQNDAVALTYSNKLFHKYKASCYADLTNLNECKCNGDTSTALDLGLGS